MVEQTNIKKQINLPAIYKLAWPAIVSHATVMIVSVIDLAFLGRLDMAASAIAAGAIANNVCAAVYSFLEGLRSGTTVLVARFLGGNKSKEISATINLALTLAIIIGFSLVAFAPFLSSFIYKLAGNNEIAARGYSYLTIRLFGLPFHLIIFAILGLFRGLKNTTIPLIVSTTICLLDAFLDYVFMYGKFGFPAMGMNGIALATFVAYVFGLILSMALMFKIPLTRKYIKYKISFRPIFKTFIKLCTEIGLYSGVVILALFLFVFMFTPLGPQAIAAHQIVFQVFIVTYLPPMGFFVASSILTGKLIGEKLYKQIIPANIIIWLASLPIVLTTCALVALFAADIAAFFSPQDRQVAELATHSIYLICIMQIFGSLYLVVKGALTAAKDTRFVFIVGTITSYGFFLSLAYILGIVFEYGVYGGYVAFLLWAILDTLIFSARFFWVKPWRFINHVRDGR